MDETPSQPTQHATQPFEDPRRSGKHVSDVSDRDLSDVICILYPNSPAAFEAVQATMLAAPQHILQNEGLEGITEDDFLTNPELFKPREFALRMTSAVKSPQAGFTFGRNQQHCDIVLVRDANEKNVSNIHFKIFVNPQGSLMLQDMSTNGTIVDDDHLRCKDWRGNRAEKPATQALKNGSLITVVGVRKSEIKLMVRIPSRADFEDLYEQKLKSYLSARGTVATFASMRENPYGCQWNGGPTYNVVGNLGKGAFATVFRFQTKKEGAFLAAKELDKRRFIKNGVLDTKFDSELKIMKDLRHPNIVEYIGCHHHQNWIYILMEYVPYGELSNQMQKRGALEESQVQTVTRQILHALRYLHQRNITHRDIKPDNILVASLDPLIVKLSDFGLSKCVNSQQTFLTTFCGTLLYCAPEIYPDYANYARGIAPKRRRAGDPAPRASPYDQSVDMWSFGAVLFHLLCGRAPIMGRGDDKGAQMLNTIMTKDVDFTPLRRLGISEDAIDFVGALMNRDPRQRPREAQCFQHPWIRDVPDVCEYPYEVENDLNVRRNMEVVLESDEALDDEEEQAAYEAAMELQQIGVFAQPYSSLPSSEAGPPVKRPRTDVEMEESKIQPALSGDVLYPVLPRVEESSVLPGAPARTNALLFGELTPSVLRSSGVFGASAPMRPELREIQNRVEQISVNDFVTMDVYDPSIAGHMNGSEGSVREVDRLSIPLPHGSAASLYGAEAQIGQLNVTSPENEMSDAATPDTTNPITPRTRDLSPDEVNGSKSVSDGATKSIAGVAPKLDRQIDLDLLADHEAFAASLKAREVSRAEKLKARAAKAITFHTNHDRAGRLNSIELARTIDAHPGRQGLRGHLAVSQNGIGETRRLRGGFDRSLPSQHPRPEELSNAGPPAALPPMILGTVTSIPGSFAEISFPLESRMTSWGRGIDCMVHYADKKDTRIPKYAIKLTFWAPGMEKHIEQGGDWKEMPGIRTLISTSTSKCIWINGHVLRKETSDGAAALFGQVYTGDIITIFAGTDGHDPFLKFRLDIFFGDSARVRPAHEQGFRIQEETAYHQQVMKERESMRVSSQENSPGHLVATMAAS